MKWPFALQKWHVSSSLGLLALPGPRPLPPKVVAEGPAGGCSFAGSAAPTPGTAPTPGAAPALDDALATPPDGPATAAAAMA